MTDLERELLAALEALLADYAEVLNEADNRRADKGYMTWGEDTSAVVARAVIAKAKGGAP